MNIITAVQTIKNLNKKRFKISSKNIKEGLLNVVKNTGFLGRWQILQENPKVICDTAHNKEGLTYIMKQLKDEKYENLHVVLGFVNDKNLNTIIDLFPKKATYYFCKPNISRGLNEDVLKEEFHKKGYYGNSYKSVNEAFKIALNNSKSSDLIYVGGSTFVVAEIV